MKEFKPAGYTSVAPYLVCNGAQKVIDFVIATFEDASLLRRVEDGSGRLRHAEVRVDDTVVMFGDGASEWPSSDAHVHVYVRDVDATFRRALAAGGVAVQAPTRKDDPDRRAGVRDSSGNTWWLATQQEA